MKRFIISMISIMVAITILGLILAFQPYVKARVQETLDNSDILIRWMEVQDTEMIEHIHRVWYLYGYAYQKSYTYKVELVDWETGNHISLTSRDSYVKFNPYEGQVVQVYLVWRKQHGDVSEYYSDIEVLGVMED